ncbi:MAG: UbiD family decarboxylase [Betaproteobacteria bacterium]|nr:UbiD family decarboxylase [Betaproteobacteria bacterium]
MSKEQPLSASANAGDSRSPGARDLRQWLALAESRGQLRTIDAEVDPEEEMTAVTFMATRRHGCEALLFRNLKGDRSGSRILINMLGASEERYALAVGLDPNLSARELIAATRQVLKRRIAPVLIPQDRARVSEVVLTGGEIDFTRFPVPKFWPGDGGRYFGTGCIVLTRNPETGVINAGVYRLQLHSPTVLGLSMVPGRHGVRNCEAAWSSGRPAEVVVALGIDPALFIAATQSFDHEDSELDVAGGFLGAPVELTRARFLDLPIPAQAEMVIEGLVHKDRLELEGPLGEWHGFYSSPAAKKPVIEVKAIHHRRSPILTAALMATYPSCEIGAYHAIARSAKICENLEAMGVPGITGAYARVWDGGDFPETDARRPCGAGARACGAVPGFGLLHQVDRRRRRGRRPDRHRSGALGDDDPGESERRHRHPAQHLDQSKRSEPGPRGSALRVQGAHQRLHAAQVHQLRAAADVPAPANLRARRRALGRIRIARSAAGPEQFPQGVGRMMSEVGMRQGSELAGKVGW